MEIGIEPLPTLLFSSDWYRLSDEQKYLNKQLMKIQATKQDIRQIAKKYLGMENLYVGSELENPKNCSGLS